MSDYTYDINFEERVRSLRQSATGMPIELQLVWVAELLCIWLLLKNRDSSNKVIHLDKAWRLTQVRYDVSKHCRTWVSDSCHSI